MDAHDRQLRPGHLDRALLERSFISGDDRASTCGQRPPAPGRPGRRQPVLARSRQAELGLLGLLAFFVVAAPSEGRELTNPLTAEEVACNERQLERLLQRMNAAREGEYHPPELPTTLLVAYSNASGFYDGLVATSELVRLDVGQIPPDDFMSSISPSTSTRAFVRCSSIPIGPSSHK
jgi:hypothetical protein